MRKNKFGFSMIEVLISVLLVTVVASASLSLHYNSFVLADKAGLKTQAYYLAKSGVEKIKIVRMQTLDEDVDGFFDSTLGPTEIFDESHEYGFSDNVVDSGSTFSEIFPANQDMRVEVQGNKFLRFFTLKQFSIDDKFMQVRVGVCYGQAAVNLTSCNTARIEKKNYVETIAVIRNKDI